MSASVAYGVTRIAWPLEKQTYSDNDITQSRETRVWERDHGMGNSLDMLGLL